MGSNVTFTSSDGRVDVVQAPEGLRADAGGEQGYQEQERSNHADEVQDVVSIGIALSTAEKLKQAKDDVEFMKVLGLSEEKAREIAGLYGPGPDNIPGKEDYYSEAVREVVIDMLSAKDGTEDKVAIFRTFETRLGEKIREKERDPLNQRKNDTEGTDGKVEPTDTKG